MKSIGMMLLLILSCKQDESLKQIKPKSDADVFGANYSMDSIVSDVKKVYEKLNQTADTVITEPSVKLAQKVFQHKEKQVIQPERKWNPGRRLEKPSVDKAVKALKKAVTPKFPSSKEEVNRYVDSLYQECIKNLDNPDGENRIRAGLALQFVDDGFFHLIEAITYFQVGKPSMALVKCDVAKSKKSKYKHDIEKITALYTAASYKQMAARSPSNSLRGDEIKAYHALYPLFGSEKFVIPKNNPDFTHRTIFEK